MKHAPYLFIPAFVIIGAANNQREWLRAIAGINVGVFFALIFSGSMPGKIIDLLFPREKT